MIERGGRWKVSKWNFHYIWSSACRGARGELPLANRHDALALGHANRLSHTGVEARSLTLVLAGVLRGAGQLPLPTKHHTHFNALERNPRSDI